MAKRLKVLVSAYACNPTQGSEKGVGWGWVTAIGRHHDLWVLTGELHRADIERAQTADPECCRNVHFRYIPRTRWTRLEKVWPPAYLWTYGLWQRAAYRAGAELHARVGFDLVHLITYVGFRVPGHLWKLDIPFVWGPIGGLENTPWRLLPVLGPRGCIHYGCRNIINPLHKRFLPGPRRAFRKANGNLIAATEGIRREILRWYAQPSRVICEIGPPERMAGAPSVRRPEEPLRLAWSGRHLPGKALPLLLDALPAVPPGIAWTLDVLGDGPERVKWQRRAERRGIAARCRWHGQVSRADALATVAASHLFVITSLKDLTSSVLLEALAQGVPVICPDHCGFSNVVTPDCGIKLPVSTPPRLIRGLAGAIGKLAADEGERQRLARGALQRIGDFAWDRKADAVNAIYARAVSAHGRH